MDTLRDAVCSDLMQARLFDRGSRDSRTGPPQPGGDGRRNGGLRRRAECGLHLTGPRPRLSAECSVPDFLSARNSHIPLLLTCGTGKRDILATVSRC